MSNLTLSALPFLTALQAEACKSSTHEIGGRRFIRFRFRRTSTETLPGIQELADLGFSVRVYTGGRIFTAEKGWWNSRATTRGKVRAHLAVEVAL